MEDTATIRRAPVSLCMIVKNEEQTLEACLSSVRPYVEEIVIVDTGSTDRTPEIAKRFADVFEIYTDCNEDNGLIKDFSMARNRSLTLATKQWILWIDGDDTVVGLEHLAEELDRVEKTRNGLPALIMLTYEYAHDEFGNCTCIQDRERLVTPKTSYRWVNPVHEVLMPFPASMIPIRYIMQHDIRVIHHKKPGKHIPDPTRNLRILSKLTEEQLANDARQRYYLGLEYSYVGKFAEAIETLEKYVLVSGWDDEKCLAYLKIAELYQSLGDYDPALATAYKAVAIKESWGECYFSLAKSCYFLAQRDKTDAAWRLWEKCANFARIGLTLPPTKTVLFVNPTDREIEIHRFLNVALSKIGNIPAALESVNEGLQKKPNDPEFLHNKTYYETLLIKQNMINETKKLIDIGSLEKGSDEVLLSFLEGKVTAVEVSPNKIDDVKKGLNTNIADVGESHSTWKSFHRRPDYPLNITQEDFPVAVVTPHCQAWGIPEQILYDDLYLTMTDAQLQALVTAVWKEFIAHDELLSAVSFLENAPYRVRHSDATHTLLANTRKMYQWVHKEETYDVGNAAVNLATGELLTYEQCPLPGPLYSQVGMRYAWISDRMPKRGASIADMGCTDGEMSNRWGLRGYDVTGIDVCTNSIQIASKQAEKFNTGVKYLRSYFKDAPQKLAGQKFDYVVCGDTYEHLIDPVIDLLKPARELVKDDGEMLLVTPHGAWFRGAFVSYAHPWLWCAKGYEWNSPDQRRAHIIAPTTWTVTKHFEQAGWWVKDCVVVDQWHQDTPGQGNVCCHALTTCPNPKGNLDVVIFTGSAWETWNPWTVGTKGIGGSEIAAINVAKLLVKQGCRVRVYNHCGQYGEGIFDGVEYHTFDKFHDLTCDVLIASRDCTALAKSHNVNASVKYLWTHDVYPLMATNELTLQATRILALSKWHKNNILNSLPYVGEDQITVTRNGIDFSRFDQFTNVQRNPHKVVCSSSPDRYLPALLNMWPKIRERVKDAELHLFYGFYNWERAAYASNDQGQIELIERLKKQIEDLKDHGVFDRGRISQDNLAYEFMSAGVWLYPTWFTETSCITAMEAQYAGLSIVTSPIAALSETVGLFGTMINGDWMSVDYQQNFINAAVNALMNTTDDQRANSRLNALNNYSWNGVVEDWLKMFHGDIEHLFIPQYRSPITI